MLERNENALVHSNLTVAILDGAAAYFYDQRNDSYARGLEFSLGLSLLTFRSSSSG